MERASLGFEYSEAGSSLIKVVGVGGGGGNAVNKMCVMGSVPGVSFLLCNTDAQALSRSSVPERITIGPKTTQGLGAGNKPERAQMAAEESEEVIRQALTQGGTRMVFITAGMGGGTGTGAAPIIAKICRDMGILTVGIVTSPFKFEGEIRLAQAQKGIENLRKQLDSLIVINNNKLRDTYGNLGIKTGFAKADEVLTIAAKGIAEVITKDFEVNIDLRDAHTVLSNSGTAIMGTGYGTGDNRAMDAVKSALESPLLNDNRITGAKNVLLLILYGKEEITMDEVAEINEYIQKEAGNSQELAAGYKTNIIMGMGEEEALEDKVMVTVVATGFSTEQQHEIIDVEPKKIVHSLDENTPFVQELDTTSSFTDISFENSLKRKQQAQSESVPSFTTPQATVSQPIRSEVGITLHAPEKKTNSITIDDSLYRVPVQYEVVERFVAAPQEEFVIYQEKKTTPKPQPVQPLQVEREVIVMEPQRPQASVTKQKAVMSAMAEEDAKIVHNLNDYLEVEEMLIHAHSPQPEEKIDEEFRAEIRVKETTSPKEQPKEENQNAYLAALKENAANRRTTFKNMSHQFSNQNNYRLEDLENTPAYMRKNVDISSSSQASAVSRSTISLDSNNVTQIRENNSFLHDNVD